MGDTKWSLVLSAMGVLIAIVTLMMGAMKDESEEVRELERRLCRLEALNNMGDCKR